jgi:hypothetical protein
VVVGRGGREGGGRGGEEGEEEGRGGTGGARTTNKDAPARSPIPRVAQKPSVPVQWQDKTRSRRKMILVIY